MVWRANPFWRRGGAPAAFCLAEKGRQAYHCASDGELYEVVVYCNTVYARPGQSHPSPSNPVGWRPATCGDMASRAIFASRVRAIPGTHRGEPRADGSMSGNDQTLVHFYRAVVAHADVWRQRTDATTNWAAATTAGMISIAFGTDTPHFILLLALCFDTIFLLMESRRYQMYDLWRRRFHWLNRYVIAPVLSDASALPAEVRRDKLDELARDLGRTIPHLRLAAAVGYRIHRNYGYLFGIGLLAWGLKLSVHPDPAAGVVEFVDRARIGALPGTGVLLLVLMFIGGVSLLALRAPSDRMIGWEETPSRYDHWRKRGRSRRGREPEGQEIPSAPVDG